MCITLSILILAVLYICVGAILLAFSIDSHRQDDIDRNCLLNLLLWPAVYGRRLTKGDRRKHD